MTSIKRILVGVDGSENALRAVEFAGVLAKGFEAEVTLALVLTPADHEMLSGKSTYMEKGAKLGGERLKPAEKLLGKMGIKHRSEVELGNPAEQLLSLAKEHDLVVVGTRGLSPFKGALIGSTSQRLVQGGQAPVVVVP